MTREMGKVLKEAAGDVQEAIDMTYYIAGEGTRLHGHTTPSELPNKYMMSHACADRCRCNDHTLEFSDGDSILEDHACSCRWKYSCIEAIAGSSIIRASFRADLA